MPHRETILLIDDSPDELAMMQAALTTQNFKVAQALNGESGLDLARRERPHLIVLDAIMPGLDGFACCRLLKRDPVCADIPVVFLTGLTETRHVVAALQAGGVDYVTKPIIIEELLARMRVHIDNSRAALGARVGLDAVGRMLLALDAEGRILWATPQAGAALAAAFPGHDKQDAEGNGLRAQLAALSGDGARQSGVLACADGAELRLDYLCESRSDEFLFRLWPPDDGDESGALRHRFGLTDREAEVLLWTARGKSNAEIGAILLISPRTVNKHLEHVFIKLGVENRTAATALALQVLVDRG